MSALSTKKLINYWLNFQAKLFGKAQSLNLVRAQQAALADSYGISSPETTERTLEAARSGQQQLKQWLGDKLRAHPFWSTGHLLLAQLSLECKSFALAYSSALAVLQLESDYPNSSRSQAAHIFLARCFLSTGAYENARQRLEPLLKNFCAHAWCTESRLKEDLAAALVSLSKFQSAQEVLESIPRADISSSAQVTLDYVKQQLNG